MNLFPTFDCVFIDGFPFMLGILRLDISQWNHRTSMKEPHLSACSILFFDEPISELSLFG